MRTALPRDLRLGNASPFTNTTCEKPRHNAEGASSFAANSYKALPQNPIGDALFPKAGRKETSPVLGSTVSILAVIPSIPATISVFPENFRPITPAEETGRREVTRTPRPGA